MSKVLFLSKKLTNNYGVSTGLQQSSQFISDYLTANGICNKTVTCIDSNDIDKEVYNFKPTHVIIHAIWVPPYKLQELVKIHPKVKWIIRIHSKLPFLANEGIAFEWLTAYTKIPNITISNNNRKGSIELKKALHTDVLYLPNMYYLNVNIADVRIPNGFVDIGCFGAVRPLKNILIQAVAAINFGNKYGKRIRFHINGHRVEQSGDQQLKNIRSLFKNYTGTHELIEHEWMPHQEFLKLVKQMEFGMQVSLSETFNIVAADFVYVGVPILVSPEIEWMPDFTKADPTNISDICSKMEDLYFNKRKYFIKSSQDELNKFNEKAGKRWLTFLNH